jgi:hypothetical protein
MSIKYIIYRCYTLTRIDLMNQEEMVDNIIALFPYHSMTLHRLLGLLFHTTALTAVPVIRPADLCRLLGVPIVSHTTVSASRQRGRAARKNRPRPRGAAALSSATR